MSLRFAEHARPDQRPLPICHVQVLPLMTGVQRAMLHVFAHLDRAVFAPSVVCQSEGPLTEELQRLDIPFQTIPSLDRPIHPVNDLKAYRELKRYFAEQRFALVHTHSSKPGIIGRLAARRAGVPVVVHHVQGFAFHEFSSRQKTWLFSRAEKWAGQHCDRVIFVNDEERRTAVAKGWLPAEKTLTIYNGVDLEELDSTSNAVSRSRFRTRQQLADDDVAIVILGRLDRQKQSMIVPEIARELETLQPDKKWRILLAGEGEFDQQLRVELAASGLGNRVSQIGWQARPVDAVTGSDIVMLPSLWEGLPLSLLEAHAASKPTVASDVKGNREVVTSRTGFLCSPRDPENYALALSRLIGDSALRERLGIAARARAETEFDAAINSRRVIALYEDLLGVTRKARKLAA